MTDILRKKLLYMSTHRGCKEMDIILGSFAESELNNLNAEDLIHYQKLLSLPDDKIYSTITSVLFDKDKNCADTELEVGNIIRKIVDFHSNNRLFQQKLR